jgi:hypothetical protein
VENGTNDENTSNVDENVSNDEENVSNDEGNESCCSGDLNVVNEDNSVDEQYYYSLPPQPTDDETMPLLIDTSEPQCVCQSYGDEVD